MGACTRTLSLLIGLAVSAVLLSAQSALSGPMSAGDSAGLKLETKEFPQGTLYTLVVPASAPYKVEPGLSKTLARVDAPVWQALYPDKKPLYIINAGFFDPANALTTSFVFQKGSLTADPRRNLQLMENESIRPYLPKIFNRTEFRTYLCREERQYKTRYDIVAHSVAAPPDCLLQSSVGAGPDLLPKVAGVEEGFVDYDAQGKVSRDPIGVCAKNARSVVGLTQAGDVILMMGAQKAAGPNDSGYKSGFTLDEMAGLLKARGAVKAMALDGGSSSSFVFQGKPYFGRLDQKGLLVKRPVKSVLVVVPR